MTMDARCPRALKVYPKKWCALAVIRLKALRNLDKPPTPKEEEILPGCVWAVSSQMACFCFHKYMKYYSKPDLSDTEIAHLLMIPVEDVRKIEKKAIIKIKKTNFCKELKKNK